MPHLIGAYAAQVVRRASPWGSGEALRHVHRTPYAICIAVVVHGADTRGMTNAQLRAALHSAGVSFRNDMDGDKWHIPQMGMGWHSTAAVIDWLRGVVAR